MKIGTYDDGGIDGSIQSITEYELGVLVGVLSTAKYWAFYTPKGSKVLSNLLSQFIEMYDVAKSNSQNPLDNQP